MTRRNNGNAPSMLEKTANGTSEKHSTNTIARSGKRSTLRNVVEPWSGTIIMHSVRRKPRQIQIRWNHLAIDFARPGSGQPA